MTEPLKPAFSKNLTPQSEIMIIRALAADFDAVAEKPEPAVSEGLVNKPLTIAVFVRQPQEQNFVLCVFKDTEVDWGETRGEKGRNGPMTRLTFVNRYGPFDDDEIIFDLARPAFMELYNKAKMEGREELDLRELTRRRDPDKTLEKMKEKSGYGGGLDF
ncbi:MAG: hypothetical protein GC185_01305 [Alphaproteobacteria bacterium]|nr:hypothetical protein [Alphaproteobacteria bacterium]